MFSSGSTAFADAQPAALDPPVETSPIGTSPIGTGTGGQSRRSIGSSEPPDMSDAIRRYQAHGDPQALRAIMEVYDWVAVACARRMHRRPEPLEDLEQVAREALIGAAARFDPDRGVLFKSFAWATAAGALRHHYRSRWQVRVPRGLQELHLLTVRALAELRAAGVHEPTVADLAAYLGVTAGEVTLALDVKYAYVAASLDQRLGADGDGPFDRALGDVDKAIEDTADRINVRNMLDRLPAAQRSVLVLHYFEGRTQADVGVALAVSQAQVSRLLRSALTALRDGLDESGEPQTCVRTTGSPDCFPEQRATHEPALIT
jgi:RNA polymerase sigma-B factor